jgi:asparagine synthetase B (glutamine-hydrolysing)
MGRVRTSCSAATLHRSAGRSVQRVRRRYCAALACGGEDRYAALLSLGAEYLLRGLVVLRRLEFCSPYVTRDVRMCAARLELPAVDWARPRTPLVRELARQAFHTSMPALLRYADRSSMAHSREIRLPFLDRRIAEFAYSLPPEFLYRYGVTKRVLRDAVRDVVPAQIIDRRDKIAFETPEARWLATPGAIARIAEVLLDPGTCVSGRLDRGVLEADVRAGRWRNANAVWRALNLELWRRAFVGSPLPSPAVSV